MRNITHLGEGNIIINSNNSRNRFSSSILHKISIQFHHCIYNHLRYHKMTNSNNNKSTVRTTRRSNNRSHRSLSKATAVVDTSSLSSPPSTSSFSSSLSSISPSSSSSSPAAAVIDNTTNNSNSILSTKHQHQHQQQRDVYDDMISNAIERLTVMSRQDNEMYSVHTQYMGTVPPLHIMRQNPEYNSNNKKLINIVDCRTKIVSWCYEVIHFCNMHTETVELAMSIIDRYMFGDMTSSLSSSSTGRYSQEYCVLDAWYDKKIYQLIAMSSLYIAIKVQEPAAFSIEMISNQLSRNTYSEEQIEDAEQHILYDIIQFKLNTPTITTYIHEYMDLLKPLLIQYQSTYELVNMIDNNDDFDETNGDDDDDDDSDENQCKKRNNKNMQAMLFHYLIDRQIQMTTIDYNMIKMKSYIKAYCILLNTFEILNVETQILASIDTILRKAVQQCNPHLQRSSSKTSRAPFTTRSNTTTVATSVPAAATTNATVTTIATTSKNHPFHNNENSNDNNDDHYYFSSSITHEIRGYLYYQVMPDYQYYHSSLFLSPSTSSASLSSSAYLNDHNDSSDASTSSSSSSSSSSSWIQQEQHDKYEVKMEPSSSYVILPPRVEEEDDDYILINSYNEEEIMMDDRINRNDCIQSFCCNSDSNNTVPRKVSPTTVSSL